MIPRRYIEEWRATAAWTFDAQVEQDLVISRAIVALFSNLFLANQLAFRGGTALYKLFIPSQARYSEDIDLVQMQAGPIKEILEQMRIALQFLGQPSIKQKANNNTALFHFDSEIPPIIRLRLKVETNCREHFAVMGYHQFPFTITSGWFTGNCNINTYHFEELIGTKLRAFYQRKKGRDLYDLDKALQTGMLDTEKVLHCYREYMIFGTGRIPSQSEFLRNTEAKLIDPEFLADTMALLKPGEAYDPVQAFDRVRAILISKMA